MLSVRSPHDRFRTLGWLAGIPVIGVTFGYTDMPVDALGADRVISHFDDLVGAVDALVPLDRAA